MGSVDNQIPLSSTWTIWTSKWKGKPNVQFLSRFDTVQTFWSNFKEYKPESLADKSYLHIFKDGIAPLWEDPQNVNGGHFKLTAITPESSLVMWQSIVLNMIGEQFPMNHCINGASIVVHGVGNNLIKVWLTTSDKETVARAKAFLISILNSEDYLTDKVTFVPHKLVLPSSNQKSQQTKANIQVPYNPFSFNNNNVQEPGNVALSSTVEQPLEDATNKHRGQKRRKSRDLGNVVPMKKQSFRRPSLVASITAPVCCGPTEVRFAHDPYSLNGGCTYLPLKCL